MKREGEKKKVWNQNLIKELQRHRVGLTTGELEGEGAVVKKEKKRMYELQVLEAEQTLVTVVDPV